jgi:hypothetical protein
MLAVSGLGVPRPLLVFGIAFAATLLGSMSGGSTSLLTTPTWLALGYPLPTAVASDKLAGTFWTLVGARNYLHRREIDRPLLAWMVGLGMIGAVAGATVTASVDPAKLKRVVGLLILMVVLGVALRPRFGAAESLPRLPRAVVIGLALPLGFYEGLLGSGNSIGVTLLLCFGRGFDLLRGLGHYYVMAAAWCAIAAISYGLHGYFDAALALPATAGAIGGGYLGSRLGSRFGVDVVRAIFLLAGVTLGLKLLVGW